MEHRRLLPAVRSLAVISALLALGVPASPASAAQRLAAHRLHAQAVSPSAIPFSLSLRPATMPLRVPNAQAYAAAKAAAERSYQGWAARHPQIGGSAPLAPRSSTPSAPRPQAVLFEGLNQAGMFGGGLNTSGTPPDTTGAIGPNDYLEMVNSEITVYDRTTLGAVASMSEEKFTGGSSTCDGQIRWDQQAERWEYASLECGLTGTEGFTFGWSKTADPTDLSLAGWCKYQVSTDFEREPGVVEKLLFDYPKLGGSDEYLLIGVNAYAEKVKPAEEYVGSGVVTISKPPKGLSTCPSGSEIEIGVQGLPVFTPVPANLYGGSTTGYVVAGEYPEGTGSAKNIDVFTVTKNSEGKPEFHQPPPVAVSAYFVPAPVPQPGTTDGIDSSDTRLTQAVAAEDPSAHQIQIWTQHTVATSSLGSPSVVRWYALKAGSSTPAQEGTIEGSLGNFAFNGAISPTALGNGAAIDYNVGGPALAAELHAQSRGPTTPADTTGDDVQLAASEAVDKDFSCPSVEPEAASCRWGDYAGASPDPLHPGVVWGTGEVNGPQVVKNGAQWRTENFALALHAPPVAAFSVTTASPIGGTPVSFDASASSDPVEPIASYEWSFGDGTTGTGEKPAHVYARPGAYTVKLTVMDGGGLTSSVEHQVTVADAPPVASFGTSASPTTAAAVSFDASTSHDPDGTIASYEWSFGDGTAGTGERPAHTYATPGTYTVKLTVVDDAGLSASVERAIAVAEPPSSTATGSSSVTTIVTVIEHTVVVTPPSNVVTVKRMKQNRKTGSVALTLLVPGPGVLGAKDAAGKSKHGGKATAALVKAVRIDVSQGGTITLQIVPTSAGRARLNRRHRLKVKLLIAFAPTGGTPRTFVATVSLSKSPAKSRHK